MQTIGKCVAVFVFVMLLVYSCSKFREKPAADKSRNQFDRTNAVVLIGESGVGDDELTDYVKARFSGKAVSQNLDQALDELVIAELLYQEAIQLGIDQKPNVRQAMRQLLGQQLLEYNVNQPVLTLHISEEELRRYYDEHQDLYARPEQIRLADIYIAVSADDDQATFAKKQKKAEDILAEAQLMSSQRFGFSQLIQDHSDKHSQYRLGDTGFFDRNGLQGGIAGELVDAGFALTENGSPAEQMVQTADGFHIIKLIAKRQAFSRDFNAVVHEIGQKIRKNELSEKRAGLIASLKTKSNVEIQQDVLENIRQELQSEREESGKNAEEPEDMKPVLPGQK